ncbi:MAG: hypothetical protein PVJ71_04415 [Lysobacterales bacterium]|jgi:hypothetical protein
MSAEKAYEACEELTVGPDFIAGDGSNVRVSAGREISFLPGFVVEKGASVNTNVCGKSLCMTDPGPMPYGCHSCVDLICEPGGNEECCLSAWDSGCVNEVATVCGLVCDPEP